jgi:hypothetical protein
MARNSIGKWGLIFFWFLHADTPALQMYSEDPAWHAPIIN